MKRAIISLAIVVTGWPLAFTAQAQNALNGAWKVVEITNEGGQNSGTATVQTPSLYIFADGYYSLMWITGDGNRPDFPPDTDVTDEEIVAAFNSFIGQSGSYEVSGSTITIHAIVSKVPGSTDNTTEIEYRFEGDTLYLSQIQPRNSRNIRTRKLVRLE